MQVAEQSSLDLTENYNQLETELREKHATIDSQLKTIKDMEAWYAKSELEKTQTNSEMSEKTLKLASIEAQCASLVQEKEQLSLSMNQKLLTKVNEYQVEYQNEFQKKEQQLECVRTMCVRLEEEKAQLQVHVKNLENELNRLICENKNLSEGLQAQVKIDSLTVKPRYNEALRPEKCPRYTETRYIEGMGDKKTKPSLKSVI